MTRAELIDIMIKHIPATENAETYMAGVSNAAFAIMELENQTIQEFIDKLEKLKELINLNPTK